MDNLKLREKLGEIKLNFYSQLEYVKYLLLRLSKYIGVIRIFPYMFSSTSRSEHYTYLAGKEKYLKNLYQSGKANIYLLRRNIHRIEKGLISKNPKSIFATAYILETVYEYERYVNLFSKGNIEERSEKSWIEGILDKYFSIVETHPNITKAEQLYKKLSDKTETAENNTPYKQNLTSPISISYEDLLELAKKRRSVRWFENKEVPRDKIDKALQIALLSPSACNRQPFKFYIFDDKEWINKLGELPPGFKEFYKEIPALAIVVGDQSAFFKDHDRHTIYIDSSLAIMSFLYGLEVQGISSCAINWNDNVKLQKKLKQAISLDDSEKVILFIALGYPNPEGKIPYSKKKNLDEVRTYNFE